MANEPLRFCVRLPQYSFKLDRPSELSRPGTPLLPVVIMRQSGTGVPDVAMGQSDPGTGKEQCWARRPVLPGQAEV